MDILYSDLEPMRLLDKQETFIDSFFSALADTTELHIAVGSICIPSLLLLDRLFESSDLKRIVLTIGTGYADGLSESLYKEVMRIARKWKDKGRGEIRLVLPFKYHGSIFCFYSKRGRHPFYGIVGSADLSAIIPDNPFSPQYELGIGLSDMKSLQQLREHLSQLEDNTSSRNILELKNVKLIPDRPVSVIGETMQVDL